MAAEEKQPIVMILGVLGVIVLAVLAYIYFGDNKEDASVRQTIDVPAAESIETQVPQTLSAQEQTDSALAMDQVPEPVDPPFIMPQLSQSDQLVRDGVGALTSNVQVEKWLVTDELTRKFVVLSDNLAEGKIPRRHVEFLAPEGSFRAVKIDDNVYELDERGYGRFDLFTDVFTSIDSRRAVEFYVLMRPLFQEAYGELGYGDNQFDEVVLATIDHLVDAPVITYPVKLVRPVVMYKFEDPKLEALSEAHKQMIRMGPGNTREIQSKLKDIGTELRKVLGE